MERVLIVADRGYNSEEGAIPDVDEGLPSQGEMLEDI